MRKLLIFLCCAFFHFALKAQAQSFTWAYNFGSSNGFEEVNDLAFDASGNLCVVGTFEGTVDFDPGPDSLFLSSSSLSDIFVAKYDTSGSPIWVKAMGGSTDDGRAIAVGPNGNIYTTGYFSGFGDFDPDTGSFVLQAGSRDVFISALDSNGSFVWAGNVGSPSNDEGHDIAVDGNGNVIVTGFFRDNADFDPGAGSTILSALSSEETFILKLDPAGNLVWAKSFEGTGSEEGYTILSDNSSNIYIGGYLSFGTTDFDPGMDTFYISSVSGAEAFLTKLDSNGDLLWVNIIDGTGSQFIKDVALDNSGNIILGGQFGGTADFDPGAGDFDLSANGFADGFVAKWDNSGAFLWANALTGAGFNTTEALHVDNQGTIYLTGFFEQSMDVDPGPGNVDLISAGLQDAFLVYYDANGNLTWSGSMSGTDNINGFTVLSNSSGSDVYCMGRFEGQADLDPTASSSSSLSNGSFDAFMLKLTSVNTGLNFSTQEINYQIYPNPSSGRVKLKMEAVGNRKVTILDQQGRILRTKEIKGAEFDLDLSDLPSAKYFIRIQGENLDLLEEVIKN